MTLKFHSRHLPRSVHEWEQLVLACGVQDDTIETHWLERKGPLQLGTARDKFAIAKAILAFANRDPEAAAPYLDGHAIILIGIEKTGEITGIPRIEDHELINALKAYLGNDDDAPRWIVHRHRVDKDNDVVIIDLDAPRPGDPIFTLRKAYDRFLAGSIFSRSSTESAPADPRAVETLSRRLIARDRGDFEVELSLNDNAISSYTYDPDVIEPLLIEAAARYIDNSKLIEPARIAKVGGSLGTLYLPSGIQHEEKRSREGFRKEIEQWATAVRQQLPEFVRHVIAFARPAAQFTITNTCGRYLEDLEVEIHIEGDVFQQPKPLDDDDVANSLPELPRAWGPWVSPLLDYDRISQNLPSYLGGVSRPQRPNSTDFRNSGSVTAVLSCRELRPGRSHTFTDDDDHLDVALLTSNADMVTARITVTATARGIDASHTAELIQAITPVGDITSTVVAFLDALDYFKITPPRSTGS